jgi:hypothetical protein
VMPTLVVSMISVLCKLGGLTAIAAAVMIGGAGGRLCVVWAVEVKLLSCCHCRWRCSSLAALSSLGVFLEVSSVQGLMICKHLMCWYQCFACKDLCGRSVPSLEEARKYHFAVCFRRVRSVRLCSCSCHVGWEGCFCRGSMNRQRGLYNLYCRAPMWRLSCSIGLWQLDITELWAHERALFYVVSRADSRIGMRNGQLTVDRIRSLSWSVCRTIALLCVT